MTTNRRDHVLSVRLTDAQHRQLEALADQLGTTVSDLVRRSIRRMFPDPNYPLHPVPQTQTQASGAPSTTSITWEKP